MTYIIIIFFLFAFEILFLRLASNRGILIVHQHNRFVDKPVDGIRKSTIRAGGILFWFAALLYTMYNTNETSLWFLLGITIIAFISFLDDFRTVSGWIHLLFHLTAISIAFYITGLFESITWWNLLTAYFIFIGIIYAFKFMDDMNGMTGLYSLAVLIPMLYVNRYVEPFVNEDFLIYPLIAALTFLFFNFRKTAVTTAGTVGSMTIAFWVGIMLLMLIVETGNIIWLSFLLVYGVDVILTLVHRTYIRKPIFGPEKLHLYQILGNELKIDHRVVSVFYFVIQLVCSALIIAFYPTYGQAIFWIMLVLLMSIYAIKFRLVKVVKHLQ